MAEFESIRQIANRLIAEHRARRTVIRTCQEEVDPEEYVPTFDGIDREWLGKMGILA